MFIINEEKRNLSRKMENIKNKNYRTKKQKIIFKNILPLGIRSRLDLQKKITVGLKRAQ